MKKYLLSAFAFALATTATAMRLDVPQTPVTAPVEHVIQTLAPDVESTLASQTRRAPSRIKTPVTKASDLVGSYSWSYKTAEDIAPTADDIATWSTGTKVVRIYDANDDNGTFKIAGMFDGILTAKLDMTSYDYPLIIVDKNLVAAYNQYYGGGYQVRGVCYNPNTGGYFYTQLRAFIYGNEIEWVDNIWMVKYGGQNSSGTSTIIGPMVKPGSLMNANTTSNAVMTYHYDDFDFGSALHVSENSSYVVSIDNFADLAVNPVTIKLSKDKTWKADKVVLYSNDNGSFVLYGVTGDNVLSQLTGTGTYTTLTSDTHWTAEDPHTEFWIGDCEPFTITLLEGRFTYPGQSNPDPALYLIGSFNGWDGNSQVPLTLAGDGTWTITRDMEAGSEFKFRNEYDQTIGAVSDATVVATPGQPIIIGVGTGSQNIRIPEADTWTISVDMNAMTVTLTKAAVEINGDLNGDGNVDIEDVNLLINLILEKTTVDQLKGNPDLDGSGTTDVADVNTLINIILTN